MKKQFYLSLFLGLVVVFSFALVSPAQAAELEQVTITPVVLHGGRISDYKVSFIVASSVEVSSQVIITFPSGFIVPAVMATSSLTAPSTTSTGVLASTSVDVSEQGITLYLGGTGAITAASETVQVTMGGIQSPYNGNADVIVDVQTRTAAGEEIDSASATTFRIIAAELISTSPLGVQSYTAPPTSQITSPTVGEVIPAEAPYVITGTVSDQGIYSANKAEVSVDGGVTWLTATVTGSSWEYTWDSPAEGSYTIMSRATDTAGNVEDPLTGSVTVTVSAAAVSPAPAPTPPPAGTIAELEVKLAEVQQQLLGLLRQLVALLTAQL